MHFVDTHAHLYQPHFKDDIAEVIDRAKEVGVIKFLLPNIDSVSMQPMLTLVKKYHESCFPMIGLHPTSVKENYMDELKLVEKELSNTGNGYIGLGEIGIDLYWDKTFLKQQQEAFRFQIELAKKHGLPIVIHARESFNEIFEVLDEVNDDRLTGVFHSFSGTREQAQKALGYGFYLGIGGIVTFKNAGLDKVVKDLPLDKLVLETDSPYLAPSPNRGKRNESANIRFVAEKIATVKSISLQEIATLTTENAQKLFRL